MSILLLILGLLLFVALVVLHEFGHFIMARRNGIEVEEFGIGFPPRAKLLAKKNGTEYTLNWLPLGGFVKLRGEHDADTEPGTFGAAPLLAKVKVMLAGVTLNLLAAFVLLTVLALAGMPQIIENQFTVPSDTKIVRQEVLIGGVEPDGPAAQAGLEPGNVIEALGPVGGERREVNSADRLSELTEQFAGQRVEVAVRDEGETKSVQVQLRDKAETEASRDEEGRPTKGYMGIGPSEYVTQRSTWSAPIVAAGIIKQFTELTFKGLGTAVSSLARGDTKTAQSQVSGPVGIFVLLKSGSVLGLGFIIMIIAILSLTLAIFNVLPIPALDGGRLYVTLLFRALRRPLTQKTEELIHGAGFAALMVLFVLITVVDVRRFF